LGTQYVVLVNIRVMNVSKYKQYLIARLRLVRDALTRISVDRDSHQPRRLLACGVRTHACGPRNANADGVVRFGADSAAGLAAAIDQVVAHRREQAVSAT
jgi:hypothetical protein